VETPRRLAQLIDTRLYDVVVVQKALLTSYLRGFGRVLRTFAKRIVLDVDDAVHVVQPHRLRTPLNRLTVDSQVRDLMRDAKLVLAGNKWLESEAVAAGGTAVHFPTVVDTDRYVVGSPQPDRFRIGWIGSASTTPYLEPVAKLLNEFRNAEVVLVGADPERVSIPNAQYRQWKLDTEVREIRHFSAGIMPSLKHEPWDLGKCGLKALQYMASGVPCVATPFGVAKEIIQDGVNGLFADSVEEWIGALERLRTKRLREEMGQTARALVEQRYALKHAAPRLIELLESVA
jgi:glycosyltransferase involved in cell wall biosynthesis